MTSLWIAFGAVYWALGSIAMVFQEREMQRFFGEDLSFLDLFFIVTVFWLIGPILFVFEKLDEVRIFRRHNITSAPHTIPDFYVKAASTSLRTSLEKSSFRTDQLVGGEKLLVKPQPADVTRLDARERIEFGHDLKLRTFWLGAPKDGVLRPRAFPQALEGMCVSDDSGLDTGAIIGKDGIAGWEWILVREALHVDDPQMGSTVSKPVGIGGAR